MISAGLLPDEPQRLEALRALQLLDTGADPRFDALTRLAARTMGAPIALVSLVDESRQWFKSRVGLEVTETSREESFCAHAVQSGDMLVVPDATQDPRFFDNPLVTGELGLRAYAGVPLKTSEGFAVGTLCTFDQKPHAFTETELETLRDLAALAQREIIACEMVAQWQKNAQQAAQASQELERLYASTVDWAGIGIGLAGLDGGWLRVNPRLCEIFGHSEDTLRQQRWPASVQAQGLSAMNALTAQLLAGHAASGSLQVPCLQADGTELWAEWRITLLRAPQGAPQCFVMLVDDITQKRATDLALRALRDDLERQVLERTQELSAAKVEAEQANAAKSRFVSNMSHELRTPLNAVLGYARRLQLSDMDAAQRSDLKKLQIASESLLSLVNDVLDMSKIEAGEFQLAQDPLDLDQLLSDIESMMAVIATSKQLALRVSSRPASMPRHYLGDVMRLRQILVNLVGNAIKFTERGHIDLRVAVLSEAPAGHMRLRFVVQDTGVGMAAADLPQLFNRFVQANTRTPHRHGGTGLGLAIVKELAERMGGRVDVQSELGHGSTFGVEVLLQLADQQTRAAAPGAPAAAENAGRVGLRLQDKKILLVDDSPSNLDIAASMLMEEGADVFVCTDGQAALNWLEQPENQADVVLMDVHMPVMDGNTATRRIRQHHRLSALPVIAMTASSTLTERQASLAAGMNDYVVKPIRHEQLMASLLRHL